MLCFLSCLQKLTGEVEALTVKRDTLQEEVTALASNGGDFKALEAKSMELGNLSQELDGKEMIWLEMAELAGDL
jgi:hypothetical protein